MSETTQQDSDESRTVTNQSSDQSESGETFTSRPTLKPTSIALSITILITLVIAGALVANPTLFGTAEITEVVLWVVFLIGGFISIRLIVKMYILTRMEYIISPDGVSREYALLYRYRRREMPIRMVRGVEVSRDPIETLLGYGTVAILSGGTNQSLGFIKFEHVPNPKQVSETLEELQKDKASSSATKEEDTQFGQELTEKDG